MCREYSITKEIPELNIMGRNIITETQVKSVPALRQKHSSDLLLQQTVNRVGMCKVPISKLYHGKWKHSNNILPAAKSA